MLSIWFPKTKITTMKSFFIIFIKKKKSYEVEVFDETNAQEARKGSMG